MRLSLIVLCAFLLGIGACDGELSLDSLCILEIPEGQHVSMDTKVCWVDKEKSQGFTLKEIHSFFSLNETDLRKITDRLNECQKLEKSMISTSGQ